MVSLTLSIMFGARTIAVLVPYISTSDFTVQNCTLLSIQKFKSKNKMTESACIKILANVQNRTTLIRRDEVDFKGACFSDCSLTIKRLRKKSSSLISNKFSKPKISADHQPALGQPQPDEQRPSDERAFARVLWA